MGVDILSSNMLEQMKLDVVCLEPEDFKPLLEKTHGVPSAHDPNREYNPYFDGKKWVCDSEKGPCEHYRIYKTPCRHILQKKFENVQDLYNHFCEKVEYSRDLRDMECRDFEEVITYVSCYRNDEINRIATIFLNLAVMRGQVSIDDFHGATNEQYANEKIVGVAVGSMKRSGYISCVGYKKTERKVAHGRPVGIYEVTRDGYDLLQESRPESPLKT
jgi:predicted transcriptional regulator